MGKELLPFQKTREFVRKLRLKSRAEWVEYYKSGKKPGDIPSNPAREYKAEWKGWGDWLGSGTIANFNKKFKPFKDAREFVHKLGLKSKTEWADYSKSRKKPQDIPASPTKTYKSEWKGWGDWLGTGRIADKDKVYRSFQDARSFVHSLGLGDRDEWNAYCKSNKKPEDMPASPAKTIPSNLKTMRKWFFRLMKFLGLKIIRMHIFEGGSYFISKMCMKATTKIPI